MEMLIVVAIIAVLVAIAIPVFNGALTKSKEAADVANIRAAYADWQVAIITGEATAPTSEEQFLTRVTGTLNYNATNNNTTASNTDKLFYKDGVISYQASKLNDGNGTNGKLYTWTLSEITFNDNNGSITQHFLLFLPLSRPTPGTGRSPRRMFPARDSRGLAAVPVPERTHHTEGAFPCCTPPPPSPYTAASSPPCWAPAWAAFSTAPRGG